MKTCSRCNQELPRDMFYRERRAPDGLYRWCKPCRKSYLAENADEVRERQHRYEKRTGRIGNGPRKRRLPPGAPPLRLRKYGLTQEQYDSMLELQESRCAICERDTPLVIDHNHATGQVRGLLCVKCNVGLGMFEDSPASLLSAIAYLGHSDSSSPSSRVLSCNAERTNR